MIFSGFILNESGLFDFDLIVAEAILFIILALFVTFAFITPITKQLDERAEFINYTLRKSNILLTFGYEKLFRMYWFVNTRNYRNESSNEIDA
jgi:hypothetical protein